MTNRNHATQATQQDDITQRVLTAEHHLNELMRLTQPWPNATIPCATVRSHVEQALSKLRAPVAPAVPKDTQEYTLRAMGRNYSGGHSWDRLDTECVTAAADEIRVLRAALASAPAAEKATGQDRMLGALATQEAKDGIGALDALYDLAIKHGASKTAASGFAHVANGAFATLEGQVHDEIRRRSLVALASTPVAGEAIYYAVLHGRALYGIFGSEAAAEACKEQAHPDAPLSVKPLYAAPQASAEDVRNATLEEAAAALEDHRRAGREWVPGSLWDTLSREAAARIRALKKPQAAQDARPCSCPSGDGSLRHPCAVHPAGRQQHARDVDDREAWAADMVAAGAQHLGDECWEWESDDFLFQLWQVATRRQQRAAFDHPVFAFLLGEGQLHGVDFGERAPGAVGKWWWRKDLRAALSATQPEQGERDE